MLDFGNNAQRPPVALRRDIDIATGILVATQGYSERDAFAELVAAARRTGIGVSRVARALIAVAGGRQLAVADRLEAQRIWDDSVIGQTLLARAR